VWEGERHETLLSWLREQLGLPTEDEEADEAQAADQEKEQAADQEKEKEPKSRRAARRRIGLWQGNAVSLGKGVAAVTAAVDDQLALEYAKRFVDQVLYRASKEQSKEDRQ